MRVLVSVVVAVVAGCGHGGLEPMKRNACTAANADPGACLFVAKERLKKGDEMGARDYMDKLVTAINAAPACLRDHEAEGCFGGVIALLRDKPVGLLAQYDVPEELLEMVPRWTGSDETGPRVQARTALEGMCSTAGHDVVAQERACIVLGDLVDDERTKRCGLACDPTNKEALNGWSTKDVIDGYFAACKVDKAHPNGPADNAFALDIAKTYNVPAAGAVCAVEKSELHGASIPEALATKERIRAETKAHQSSASAAAKREAERMAAMEKAKATAAAAALKRENEQFDKDVLDAIHRSDWAGTYGLLTRRRGSPIDDTVATALDKIFDPFVEWAIAQSNAPAAYLEMTSRLAMAPKNHAIRVHLATFRDRALADAKKDAKKARGLGGVWLHAAIVARVAGPDFPDEAAAAKTAWTKLVSATRTSLVLESLDPACQPLVRPSFAGGRTVKAKAALQCTIEPEKTTTVKEPFKVKQHVVDAQGERDVEQESSVDVTHRTYKVAVHGVIAIYSGAPRKAVPIDFEEAVDDTDGTDKRTFDGARKSAMDLITSSTVGTLEQADAAKAYAAAQQAVKAQRPEAAENQLVIHGVLVGGSPELDEMMLGYGVAFADLLPQQ